MLSTLILQLLSKESCLFSSTLVGIGIVISGDVLGLSESWSSMVTYASDTATSDFSVSKTFDFVFEDAFAFLLMPVLLPEALGLLLFFSSDVEPLKV